MPKIKGWSRLDSNILFDHYNNDYGAGHITISNRKQNCLVRYKKVGSKNIPVTMDGYYVSGYVRNKRLHKILNTKQQAHKFGINWMKKHPRG